MAGNLQNISLGGDVFIGEQGLNLIGIPSGQILAYYTGSHTVGQSAPAATVTVGNAGNFYVSPSDFVGRTGNWYIGNTRQVTIVVNDPSQTVAVCDQQSGKDVTGKSIPAGDFLIFRMETNLNVIPRERNPDAAGFMTLKVKSSDGTVYTALQQSATVSQMLTNQAPNSMPYYWNNIPLALGSSEGWATGFLGTQGERVYKNGGYTFWTESNLNGMKENYKDASGNDYTGKTVSAVRTITIASDTVSIEA